MYERLKKLRNNNNFSKKDIANILGINVNLYSKYENGTKNIPIIYLSLLAKTYNTSIDYIVGDTDDIKPHTKRLS